LGIFAIALATAIFPALSADALDADRQRFRDGLLRGIKVTLWEGFACSAGLVLVAYPAVQVLFEGGKFTSHDTPLVAQSVRFYSIAIWAFSLQQILNRAYYALHDTMTPLIMSIVALVVEMSIKLPLLWTPLGESGMAAGTAASYTLQSLVMLWMLQHKTGSLHLSQLTGFIARLLIATALMILACLLIQKAPFYPTSPTRHAALLRLILLITTGAAIYLATCLALGIDLLQHVLPKRKKSLSAEF
ncbi:MAG: murein biosynthesis integral membrane protein MurJ, partial [Bacillota bacterium]